MKLYGNTMKLGLALSGGGFRASFFHIGVLARMAEIGKLRQVEVISTVSGGSIVGAMYYIKLKKLLDKNASPTNEQLVNLVQDLEVEFLKSVQQNIRTRALSNPFKNLRMSMANYSISDSLAELYDALFYRPVLNPDGKEMVKMRDLKISPGGKTVSPDSYNNSLGDKECKLPIILINATSLNTGHNWRFEASTMGEPDSTKLSLLVTDSHPHYSRPKKYEELPDKPRDTKLGHAVAASACVPGLFVPLAISNLYKDARIQLVDGGVHDNQGTEALLDRGCKEIIISDAAGYLDDEKMPSSHIFQVIMRSNKILMDRVRNEEMREVLSDKGIKSTLLYLRKGIARRTIPYIGEKTIPDEHQSDGSLDYDVHPKIQDALSNIRTDLDSFSDIEADALMADGYLMSRHGFKEKQILTKGQWRFSYLFDEMRNNNNHKLMKHLKVSGKKFGKAFRLNPMLSMPLLLFFIAVFLVVIYLLFGDNISAFMNAPLEMKTNKDLFIYILVILVFGYVSYKISRWKDFYTAYKIIRFFSQPTAFVGRLLFRTLPQMLGSIFLWIHLAVFDQIFLKAGKRKNFKS